MSPDRTKHIGASREQGICSVFALLVAVVLLTGCAAPSLRSYEDPESGLSLTMPSDWQVERSERVLAYVLEPKPTMFSQDSVRIVIVPMALSNVPISRTLEEALESEVDRLNTHFFKLDDVAYIQPIRVVENEGYEMATVTISVPTTSIPEDSPRNQMGQRVPSVSQTIDIYVMENGPDFYATVEVYKGRDSQLNTQADRIVDTIRFSK